MVAAFHPSNFPRQSFNQTLIGREAVSQDIGSMTAQTATPGFRNHGSARQTAAIALGGGGARGVAHLGVIEVLEQTSIDIRHYVGVSIGSLAAALCAVDSDIAAVQNRVINFLTSDDFKASQAAFFSTVPEAQEPMKSGLFAWYHRVVKYLGARRKLSAMFSKPALLPDDVLTKVIDGLVPDIDIRETKTPVTIVALDLLSGRQVQLTEGSLRLAVKASASIPGVFPPVPWENKLLCDIGTIDSVPTAIARSYNEDLTIAVPVGGRVEPIESCSTAVDIFVRLYDVAEPLLREYTRGLADLVIHPDVSEIPWYDFSQPEVLIDRGREATRRLTVSTHAATSL